MFLHVVLDYEQLKRLGIDDFKSFCNGREGVELPNAFIGQSVLVRIQALVDDALETEGICDIKVCYSLL